MRVCYLNPTGILGGAERSLLDVTRAVRIAEPSLDLSAILLGDGPLAQLLVQSGVQTRVISLPDELAAAGDSAASSASSQVRIVARMLGALPLAARVARRLRQELLELNADILHSNGFKTHLLMRLVAPPTTRVVWHVRDFVSSRPLLSDLLPAAFGRDACVIANSRAVAADVRRHAPIDVPVHAIHNAVDLDHFSPGDGDGRWLDEQAGLSPAPPETIRVGLIATFARWKGQDLFIRAAAQSAARRCVPTRFYVVGGPVYQTAGSQWTLEELRQLVRRAGMSDRLGLVPFQADPLKVYRSLDIVVHASVNPEPFGRVIAEAMACGRAVVVSRAGGASELFVDQAEAVGVPPNDADALARTIARLARDRPRRHALGVAARARATRSFSLERMGCAICDVYRGLSPRLKNV